MEKGTKQKNTQEITRLLRRINQGADPKILSKEANRLLSDADPREIATAEQNLIDQGFPAQLAQQLSAAFVLMGIDQKRSGDLRIHLPAGHVLHKVIAEHELIRCFIADLEEVEADIQQQKTMTNTSSEFRRLSHIVEHLDAMEEHIEREEDVIFPFLKKYGWASLCRSAKNEHVYLRIAISDLVTLIGTYNNHNLREFKARLDSITSYLCPVMQDHIFQEDNVIYPIALEVINDEKLWEKLKALCDEIGYCGVHI